MDFKDQYQRPEWQKKRLSILKRDKWKCTICGADDLQLHVHHLKYPSKNKFIWQIENKFLLTVCNDCHMILHNFVQFIEFGIKKKILIPYNMLKLMFDAKIFKR